MHVSCVHTHLSICMCVDMPVCIPSWMYKYVNVPVFTVLFAYVCCAYIPSFVLEYMFWNSVNECVSMSLLAYKCVCVYEDDLACVCRDECYQFFFCRCTSMWEYVIVLPCVQVRGHTFVSKSIWESKYKWIFFCLHTSHMDVWTCGAIHGVHICYFCVFLSIFRSPCLIVYIEKWMLYKFVCMWICSQVYMWICSIVCISLCVLECSYMNTSSHWQACTHLGIYMCEYTHAWICVNILVYINDFHKEHVNYAIQAEI